MSELKVVSFKIGEEEYAIDIMKIDSIVQVDKINRIPEAPFFVEGVMDFRGTVIPVISGRKKFSDSSERSVDGTDRAIVITTANKKVAILVDEVREVISLPQETLEEPPQEIANEGNKYISAISNIKGRMIIVLDVAKILNEKEAVSLSNLI